MQWRNQFVPYMQQAQSIPDVNETPNDSFLTNQAYSIAQSYNGASKSFNYQTNQLDYSSNPQRQANRKDFDDSYLNNTPNIKKPSLSNISTVEEEEIFSSNGQISVTSDESTAYSSPSFSEFFPLHSTYSSKSPKDAGVVDHSSAITKRSRMGCLTCRNRKKRCCETKPKCHECSRLGLICSWPAPGAEHRNKPRNAKETEGMHYDSFYGNIKILRGIVEKKNANSI